MATKIVKPAVKKSVKVGVKPAVVATAKKTTSKTEKKSLTVHIVDTKGAAAGTMTLPEELFGAKVNKNLLAQAVRIYQANQRSGNASVKTRGQVTGSTRKIYKQKGTGKARHGGIRAPIFVGGGIVFGPTPRDYSLDLPKKMKSVALASALTHVFEQGFITFVDGFESLPAKTKAIAESLRVLEAGSSVLLVIAEKSGSVARSSRNIEGVEIMPISNIHPYALLSHKKVIIMKQAVAEAAKRFIKTV
ncbi:50S ribosomal protein L4 [Candidatus Woesebacteria bacterium]|nr:50S ribosomal protein L4 [Candidatus Woesebacteria bacterium]